MIKIDRGQEGERVFMCPLKTSVPMLHSSLNFFLSALIPLLTANQTLETGEV